MKKITFLFLVLGISMGQLRAQEKHPSPEKMKAKKIAFITTNLDLTPEEAEKFWPVYNQAEEEFQTLHKEHRQARPEKKISDMSDAEVEKLIDEGLEFQQKELNLRKKFHEKFKQVLPVKKVAQLLHLEHEFRKQQDKKGEHPGPPPGGHGPPPPGR